MSESLTTPPQLHDNLGTVALFDLRWDLSDSSVGRATYLAGHIPGAVFVDLDTDLSSPDGPGRHPLPEPTSFATTLARLGVSLHTDVVVYDDAGGSIAARLWWMLRAIGHRGSVKLLDGGFGQWIEAGYEVATGDSPAAYKSYPHPPHGFRGVVGREGVHNDRLHVLVDARTPERFRGDYEPVDARPGHIPGAINIPWQSLLTPDHLFRPASELRDLFVAAGADRRPIIVSCGSGVTSCLLALAMELAGLPRPLLYVGSYSDWADSDLPVEPDDG